MLIAIVNLLEKAYTLRQVDLVYLVLTTTWRTSNSLIYQQIVLQWEH